MSVVRVLAVSSWILVACQGPAPSIPHERPVRVEQPVPASELGVVHLTAEAAHRIALQTAKVDERNMPAARLVGGEVIVPPGRSTTVSAPVGGELRAPPGRSPPVPGASVVRGEGILLLVPFASIDRDVRARAEREVAVSQAQLVAADARVSRLSQSGADQAVSRRSYEDAVAARDILRADLRAAEARAALTRSAPLLSDVSLAIKAPHDGVVRALFVAPGQAVAAGAPLLELVAVEALQVRVPVYAGDLTRLDVTASARVRSLSAPPSDAASAAPISGPPTSAPDRNTVDRYFALEPGARFAPGERVLVEIAQRSEQSARSVPSSAVIYDAGGNAWVYACLAELAFQRARIDPLRVVADRTVFARGPEAGSCVVSVGATELFGSEFEPGH